MPEESLSEFLMRDPLAEIEHRIAAEEIRTRMPRLFVDGRSDSELLAFRHFVELVPWRYWSNDQAEYAHRLLRKDFDRSERAIRGRGSSLNIAFNTLFALGSFDSSEESLDHNRAAEMVAVATELLPAYLRWTEHIFGNLLEVYWAVGKKSNEQGRFDLKSATAQLKQRGHDDLLRGYSEDVRNAIAHGEVRFSFPDIHFGAVRPTALSSTELLRLFDDLRRTVNALAVALIDFWGELERSGRSTGQDVPIALAVRIAAAGVNREGLTMIGAVESETPLAGKQLHVAVDTIDKRRTLVFGHVFRIATRLVKAGAVNYDRMLFGIEQGEPVQSLVALDPMKLKELLEQGAPLERLPDTLDETQLMWFDESPARVRLRIWGTAIRSGWADAKRQIYINWHETGLYLGRGKYRLRKIDNLSIKGKARVRVIGVLKDPLLENDREQIQEIVAELMKEGRKRRVRARGAFLDKGIPWRKKPSHVYVDLYKEDGPIRWLRSGGWIGGNLAAVGEKCWGKQEHNLVKRPEDIHRGIRLRYSIDPIAAAEVAAKLHELMNQVQERAARKKR
jgi:hypothetical protein